jgi:hypothetical protein
MAETPKWDDYGIAHSQYVNTEGRIVGEVKEAWRCWEAFCGGHVGEFRDKASAQRAVEKSYTQLEASEVGPVTNEELEAARTPLSAGVATDAKHEELARTLRQALFITKAGFPAVPLNMALDALADLASTISPPSAREGRSEIEEAAIAYVAAQKEWTDCELTGGGLQGADRSAKDAS